MFQSLSLLLLVILVNLYMSSGKYINLDSLNICWSLDGLEVKLKSLSHSPHKYLLSLLGPMQSVRQLPQQLKAVWKETPMRIVKRNKKTIGADPGELTHLFLCEYYCSHDFWSAVASRFLSCIWDWLFGISLSLLAYLSSCFWNHSSSSTVHFYLESFDFLSLYFSWNPTVHLFILICGSWPWIGGE